MQHGTRLTDFIQGGITAFYGGQAITIILGAVIPQFHTLENTLPTRFVLTYIQNQQVLTYIS